jgi:hypothetical protein
VGSIISTFLVVITQLQLLQISTEPVQKDRFFIEKHEG